MPCLPLHSEVPGRLACLLGMHGGAGNLNSDPQAACRYFSGWVISPGSSIFSLKAAECLMNYMIHHKLWLTKILKIIHLRVFLIVQQEPEIISRESKTISISSIVFVFSPCHILDLEIISKVFFQSLYPQMWKTINLAKQSVLCLDWKIP